MTAWNNRTRLIYLVLVLLVVVMALVSARYGAVRLEISDITASISKTLGGNGEMTLSERIFMDIRLPRVLLCILVGASLAVGGTLLQALFRNPIVEPGLVGTSSGAALGAALYFTLGAKFQINAGEWTLPIAACLGGVLATWLVLALSQSRDTGKSSIVTILLTGIAINALCISGVGFMSYIARDPQARSITFWGLGTLSGSNWHAVAIVGISTILTVLAAMRYAKQLNALMIGEGEAMFLGVNIRRLKLHVLTINVIMVAVATAFVGVISFVGLIVPHLLRMLHGSDNRYLITASVLLGALLLLAADFIARMAVPPAELPIGIVTSVVGVPIFIFLLRKNKYLF
ncbi:MAG: iron ABC transporter permease [Saprospiraceae bacterium]|nr:iron ABC transporter permease [Saprospiraceae bacterium]